MHQILGVSHTGKLSQNTIYHEKRIHCSTRICAIKADLCKNQICEIGVKVDFQIMFFC